MIPPGVISFPVIPPHESHGAGALKSEFTWRDHFPRGGITECTWRDYFLLIFIIGIETVEKRDLHLSVLTKPTKREFIKGNPAISEEK